MPSLKIALTIRHVLRRQCQFIKVIRFFRLLALLPSKFKKGKEEQVVIKKTVEFATNNKIKIMAEKD